VSWLEETFWGRRHLITVSYGDVGYASLYPLYFGNRDRLVPLAPDFSMLSINFADSAHLKVDGLVVSATAVAGGDVSHRKDHTDAHSACAPTRR
jgi:hypothetical protein